MRRRPNNHGEDGFGKWVVEETENGHGQRHSQKTMATTITMLLTVHADEKRTPRLLFSVLGAHNQPGNLVLVAATGAASAVAWVVQLQLPVPAKVVDQLGMQSEMQ